MALLLAAGAALLGAVLGASRTQQTYWFNEVTKVTQWEEPPKYESIDGRGWHPQDACVHWHIVRNSGRRAGCFGFQVPTTSLVSWSSMRASSTGQP